MKIKILAFSVLFTSALFAYEQMPQNATHGVVDKDKWVNLDKNWVYCESGMNQAPINFSTKNSTKKPHSLSFSYANNSFGFINDGYTIKMHFGSNESSILFDEVVYDLSHFHFHSPSKISINNQSYPLEIHFSHVSKKGDIVVVVLFIQEGKENAFIKKTIRAFPKKEGDKLYVQGLNANELLPNNTNVFYIFKHKLNKPCSKKITWIVLKEKTQASKEQIQAIKALMGKGDNLKIQNIQKVDFSD
ncbi:carbonic anhydrase alpha [Campylobacter peloridis]|uniref:carbonic anhydrase n=1 Tax=Campylobacter peloridis TaxID=488546 RepID=A0ABX6TUJ5_9BACT|nr:carbonic anhydrase alpha [Campylobacter peloridis]AJC85410.1 carbonic anhydrase alpha [Campylobacter peloridis LMG 23910]QOQ89417.1 carbonic anhydrase alpha [Campylobacter peloridis]